MPHAVRVYHRSLGALCHEVSSKPALSPTTAARRADAVATLAELMGHQAAHEAHLPSPVVDESANARTGGAGSATAPPAIQSLQ